MKAVILAATTVLVAMTVQPCHAQDEMMMPQPTAEHEVLKMEVGNWDATMKMYFEGPEGDAVVSAGTETNGTIGGFWVTSKLEYEMMGQSVVGHGTFGYDPSIKKYVGTWNDSASPFITTMEGDYDEASKSLNWMMAGKNPDGSPSKMKATTVYKDDDHKSFTMLMEIPGQEGEWVKFLEVEYTRKK